MSYVVKESKIVEEETETVIEFKKPTTQLNTLCRKLNLGSGFVGFTPLFFAESWK